MKTYRMSIALAALAALFFSALACDASTFGFGTTTPAPSGPPHFYLASDKAGTHETYTFSQTDTVYILIDTKGLPPGVVFDVKWYGLTTGGQDPNAVLAYQTISHDGRSPVVETWFGSGGKLPLGNYRVEVYENGIKIGEMEFSVV
ncbi:MAG: hypothetical protein HY258_07120 [Chloroflexi bacterium]|nr:hypothetical protein [Chloroflexota bacterium]